MPKVVPGTITVSACVNYKRLAEIIVWAKTEGIQFSTRSGVIREILDIFHGMLKMSGKIPIELGESQIEAVLGELGIAVIRGKGQRNIVPVSTAMAEAFLASMKATRYLEMQGDVIESGDTGNMEEMRQQTLAIIEQAKKEGHLVEDEQDDECAPFDPDENIDVLSAISLKSHKRKEITEE
jgi:hypothetical protein